MPNAAEDVVSIDALSHRFGRFEALRNVSLTVGRGDVYGLLGLNGAGKTTILRLILGLLRLQSGRIEILGRPMPGARLAVSSRIGAMIEGPAFYPHLTGLKNLTLLAGLGGVAASDVGPAQALETVGLSEAARVRVSKYSMGMLQRLYIAQALLGSPDLIILDEPTSNLDPKGIMDVRELILRLNRESGVTVILSSHQLIEVEDVCDRVAILHRGARIAESEVADLFRSELCQFHIEVDRPEDALNTMRNIDWCEAAKRNEQHIEVRVPRDRRGELNTILVQAGLTVSELSERRPTLEEYFHERISEIDS